MTAAPSSGVKAGEVPTTGRSSSRITPRAARCAPIGARHSLPMVTL